jgi:hypothetical protein
LARLAAFFRKQFQQTRPAAAAESFLSMLLLLLLLLLPLLLALAHPAGTAAPGRAPPPPQPPTVADGRSSRSACGAALAEACDESASLAACRICCGTHQHTLRSAGCTGDDCEEYCATTHSTGPPPTVMCTGAAKQDDALLKTAIAALPAGVELKILGECEVSETVVLRGGRSYVGGGRTTTIKQADGANLGAVVASDSWVENAHTCGTPLRLSHIGINGNRAANTRGHGLVLHSWLSVIEDVEVSNAPEDGIRVTAVGEDNSTIITNTQVNSRFTNLFVTDCGGDGIRIEDPHGSVTDSIIESSWIAESGQSAINMDDAAGWQVINNHLYGVQRHGVYANRCFGTTIADNYIEDFGGMQQSEDSAEGTADDKATFYGIACTVQGGATSVIRNNKVLMMGGKARNASIVERSEFVYIGIPQVNYGEGIINVIGNAIRGANSTADVGLSYAARKAGTELVMISALNLVEGVGVKRVVATEGVRMEPGL